MAPDSGYNDVSSMMLVIQNRSLTSQTCHHIVSPTSMKSQIPDRLGTKTYQK